MALVLKRRDIQKGSSHTTWPTANSSEEDREKRWGRSVSQSVLSINRQGESSFWVISLTADDVQSWPINLHCHISPRTPREKCPGAIFSRFLSSSGTSMLAVFISVAPNYRSAAGDFDFNMHIHFPTLYYGDYQVYRKITKKLHKTPNSCHLYSMLKISPATHWSASR